MAESNTDRTSRFYSDSTHSAPPPTFSCKKPREEQEKDTDSAPETKRRKPCPTTLDKIEELSTSNGNLSFTFDTKFIPCAPEFTPKFGSFNLVEKEQEILCDQLLQNFKNEEGDGREPEQKSGVCEEGNGVGVGELGKI